VSATASTWANDSGLYKPQGANFISDAIATRARILTFDKMFASSLDDTTESDSLETPSSKRKINSNQNSFLLLLTGRSPCCGE
jgi:hypothetical protein